MRYIIDKDTCLFELPIGEINEEKDKIEFMLQLTYNISIGLEKLHVNINSKCYVSIDNLKTFHFHQMVGLLVTQLHA